MGQEKKRRRLFLEYEEELGFLEAFHEKLSLLYDKLGTAPSNSNHDDIAAAKKKITSLMEEVEAKRKLLFDKEHFERHIELVKVLQRRLKNKLMKRKIARFLKSPENSVGHRRYQIENEIINTEVVYGRRLHTLCSQFLVPFQSSEEIAKMVSPEDVRVIFNNIESLYATSQNLLHRIQTSPEPSPSSQQPPPTPPSGPLQAPHTNVQPRFPSRVSLGTHLLELRTWFMMYCDYIMNYEKAREKLSELRAATPKFSSLLRKLEQKAKIEGLVTLEQFLSLPIQRISRYSTLLPDLLKHTPTEHIDKESLEAAVEIVREIAGCVEDSKKGLEMAEKLASIAKNILDVPKDTPVVQPHRQHLTEGVLFRCDVFEEEVPIFISPSRLSLRKSIMIRAPLPFLGKGKEEDASPFTGELDPFYCFLFNDVLLITIDRAAYFGPKYKFVNFLGNYASLQIELSPQIPPPLADKADQFHFFKLLFPRSSYLVATKTTEEKEVWVKSFESVIQSSLAKGKDVASEVKNDLLEPMRCEGVLLKQGAYLKMWSERYCLVRGTTLFLAMKEGETAYAKIDLERSSFEHSDEELTFRLREKEVYHFAAKSKNDLRKWTHTFSSCSCRGLQPQYVYDTRKAPRSDDLDIGHSYNHKFISGGERGEEGTATTFGKVEEEKVDDGSEGEDFGFDEHDLITVEFEIEDEEEEEEQSTEAQETKEAQDAPAAPTKVAWIRELDSRN